MCSNFQYARHDIPLVSGGLKPLQRLQSDKKKIALTHGQSLVINKQLKKSQQIYFLVFVVVVNNSQLHTQHFAIKLSVVISFMAVVLFAAYRLSTQTLKRVQHATR